MLYPVAYYIVYEVWLCRAIALWGCIALIHSAALAQTTVAPSSISASTSNILTEIEQMRSAGRKDTAYLRRLLTATEDLNYQDKAPSFLAEARILIKDVANPLLVADFWVIAGLQARAEGRFSAAADTLRMALDRYIALGDKMRVAHAYSRLGLLYHQLGQYESAIEFHVSALELAKEIGYTEIIFRQDINLAHLLTVLGKPERSLALLYHAQSIMPSGAAIQRQVALHQYTAEALLQVGKPDSAAIVLQKAMSLTRKTEFKDSLVIAFLYGDAAHIEQKRGNTEQAQIMLDSALAFEAKLGFNHDNIRLRVEAARVMMIRASQETSPERKNSLYRTAVNYAKPALENKSVVRLYRLILRQMLAEAYSSLGDYKSSFMVEREYIQLRDSLLNTGLERLITSVEERLNRNKREKEIERLQVLNAAQQRIQFLLGLTALVLIAFLLVLWNRFRLKKRSEALVEAMNVELQATNAQLLQANMLLNHANEGLSLANIRAEEVSKMKQSFLEVLSHEIRTPLTAVQGYAEILSWDVQDPQQRDYAERISGAVRHLLLLFEDMLHLAKMHTNQVALEVHPVSLRDLCRQVCAMYEAQASEKGVHLHYEVSPSIVQHVLLDEAKIRLILVNLLGNAVKFTEQGSVKLTLAPASTEAHNGEARFDIGTVNKSCVGNCLLFMVEDTGIGIPADALPYIFDTFRHTDTEIHRKYGGLGLGLAICKSFVDMMNGTITVKSIEGQGTVFRVLLPIQKEVLDNAE